MKEYVKPDINEIELRTEELIAFESNVENPQYVP
jgi:hypothetical protein